MNKDIIACIDLALELAAKIFEAQNGNNYNAGYIGYSLEYENDSSHLYSWEKPKEPRGHLEYFTLEWEIGGATGGNCWGNEAQEYKINTNVSQLDGLIIFLNTVVPEFKLKDYPKILCLIETDTFTRSEYYGNYKEYTQRRISVPSLIKTIEECGHKFDIVSLEQSLDQLNQQLHNLSVKPLQIPAKKY